jgi:transcriptional regulator with GAF, ATPase, and Fis domain
MPEPAATTDILDIDIREVYTPPGSARRGPCFGGLIGSSELMLGLFELLRRVADSDSTLLVSGESGTGKEVVAKGLHVCSPRSKGPFVPVHCGAIPETLLESELFGHEKGAFTGATSFRAGRFEMAHKGTIFLDEVADMSPALQVKILRVLQEREFERVGGVKTLKVDVRIVAASNQDLEIAVNEKRFREDLYYRLNVIPVTLPPLRARREDIPLLVEHFMTRLETRKGKRVDGISSRVMKMLMEYDWPGNVRELENIIERLVILKGGGVIEPFDLPERFHNNMRRFGEGISLGVNGMGCVEIPEEGVNMNAMVEKFERDLLMKALRQTDWVKSKAARLLSIKRTTLIEKMKRMNIATPVFI